jgi:alpha-mannosidase
LPYPQTTAWRPTIGTSARSSGPTPKSRQFEVASHQWIDLTDQSGAYGATILTDCKNGSDKRDDHTIRLTLIRTPGFPPGNRGRAYSDQLNQDWGHHEFVFGVAGHAGDWRQAQTDWQAYRLNQPLEAFETSRHTGPLGKQFSFLSISNPRIRVLALKKAEMSDEIILRTVEIDGRQAPDVRVKFAGPVVAASEVNGQELPVGPARIADGALAAAFSPYQPRTFAMRLGPPPAHVPAVESRPVALAYDLSVTSNDDTKVEGASIRRAMQFPPRCFPRTLSLPA